MERVRAVTKTKMKTWSDKLISDIRRPKEGSMIQYELRVCLTNNLGFSQVASHKWGRRHK